MNKQITWLCVEKNDHPDKYKKNKDSDFEKKLELFFKKILKDKKFEQKIEKKTLDFEKKIETFAELIKNDNLDFKNKTNAFNDKELKKEKIDCTWECWYDQMGNLIKKNEKKSKILKKSIQKLFEKVEKNVKNNIKKN